MSPLVTESSTAESSTAESITELNTAELSTAELSTAEVSAAELTPARSDETQLESIDGIVFPPSDLYSDEPPLETYQHLQQMVLLLKCLDWLWKDRNDYFSAGNLTVYYSLRRLKSEDFRGPDFFVVLNTEKRPRKSWTVWEEDGQYPNIIVELLSDSTAKTDRGLKKQIYQDIFRTPDYFWFDPHNLEFQGFSLVSGTYRPLQPNSRGHLWSEQLGLYLGVLEGMLRFFTAEGELVPTLEEATEAALQEAAAAQQKAETALQEAATAQQEAEAAQQEAATAQQEAEAAQQEAEAAQQEAATAQQEAATAQQEAATAQQEVATAQQEVATAQQEVATAQQEVATAQQEAEAAQQEAATAQQRTELLADKLRELGIDPDAL
jgi:Uma2 family endonuclease